MSSLNKGYGRIEISLKWDPSPSGEPATDLDIIAAPYPATDPYGDPAYVVHPDSRSPDGTITVDRDSTDGQGLGYDEIMTVELDRVHEQYARVVVGIVIQQQSPRTFARVIRPGLRIREGYTVLSETDFSGVPDATAAVVAEFRREGTGPWEADFAIRGFDEDPVNFARVMGAARRP
ncbi:TerD family protein [Streptomyces sp. NPDC012461]|uniref:TerD family protein n=2 Tax=unclassified Streptomyces TaxID=2593676 RepID=A0A6G3QNV2_9ACTN|nr:TerD family protein [Streptomyces sp. S12]NEA85025.1 TerD family protein [Streptomyces sp. SID14436]NEC78607.1 TerD family protein [Streptomyces sp. SID7958]NED17254.1 TerD family protein [Streptomyces sp. SID9913]